MGKDEKNKGSNFIENKEPAEQFEYSIVMARRLLQLFGMWPVESRFYSKIRIVLVAFGTYLLAFFFIPCILHMFLIEKEFKVRLRQMGPQSFCLMNICKYAAILLKGQEIRECVLWMEEDWRKAGATERRIMIQSTYTARLFIKICIIFMYGSGMLYTSIFNFTVEPILVRNVSMRPITYPCYFFFIDPYTRPFYDVILLTHSMAGFLTYTVTGAVCSLAIVCIMHICGQIAVASWMLDNLVGNYDKEAFGNIIVKHLRSLQFATKLEFILTEICLVEMMGCTFNICMLGYYFITEYDQTTSIGPYIYCMLLVSFTFNIFIFCYFGDRLTEQCDTIGDVAYMVDWYQLTAKEARNLILIVASTQHSVVLTAGKMANLNLQSFSNVLKASFTYLNMLRTVTYAS